MQLFLTGQAGTTVKISFISRFKEGYYLKLLNSFMFKTEMLISELILLSLQFSAPQGITTIPAPTVAFVVPLELIRWSLAKTTALPALETLLLILMDPQTLCSAKVSANYKKVPFLALLKSK